MASVVTLVTLAMAMAVRGAETSCITAACFCERSAATQLLVVNCIRCNLTRVPHFNDTDELITELTMADNNLAELPEAAFLRLRIRRLDLRGNQLRTIAATAFDGLQTSLEQIVLQLHSSATFPVHALASLRQLRFLEIIGYYGNGQLPTNPFTAFSRLNVLRLTQGGLTKLSQTDMRPLNSSLSVLDLTENPLGKVPDAISILSNLTELVLSKCQLTVLSSRTFDTQLPSVGLQLIDLSFNQLSTVDKFAFSGSRVAPSLRSLLLRTTHLEDHHVESLQLLADLRHLDVSYNKLTSIDVLLRSVKSLETLDASYNAIRFLNGLQTAGAGGNLRVLKLSDNANMNVSADAFIGMSLLEDLHMEAARVSLTNDTFSSPRHTLQTLTLRRCNFTGTSIWSAISQLSALDALFLTQCGLASVPDFAFLGLRRLRTLELRDNRIGHVTQRALAGLESHLQTATFDNNRLTSLSPCVFHQFTNIDYLRLGLAGNPLQCVCDLQWLYDRLQSPQDDFLYKTLRWNCTDVNKPFIYLNDGDFLSCSTSASVCEDLVASTTTSVTADSSCANNCSTSDGDDLSATASLSLELIIALSVSASVVLILAVVIATVCVRLRQRGRTTSARDSYTSPKYSVQTKRYRRRDDNQTPTRVSSNTYKPTDVDRAIVETVDKLDAESKEALANLLRTASRDQLHATDNTDRNHLYEELDDDLYDHIPTDDTV